MIRLIASAAITINNILFIIFLALLGFRAYNVLAAVMGTPEQQGELPNLLAKLWQAFSDQDIPLVLGGLIATGGVSLLGAMWLEFREARGLSSKPRSS